MTSRNLTKGNTLLMTITKGRDVSQSGTSGSKFKTDYTVTEGEEGKK